MIYYCQHCGIRFKRDPSKDPRRLAKHCSRACKAAATRKIKPEAVRQAALSGVPALELSKQLGITPLRLREWMRRDGVWKAWRELRFTS